MSPVARATDPLTSWEAAFSVDRDRLLLTQRHIMDILWAHPEGLTDEEIWDALGEAGAQHFTSPSGARTRRDELVEQGYVISTHTRRRARTGRHMTVWTVATPHPVPRGPTGRPLTAVRPGPGPGDAPGQQSGTPPAYRCTRCGMTSFTRPAEPVLGGYLRGTCLACRRKTLWTAA